MFGLRRKQQVVLYSMDRNADAAVAASLKRTRGLKLRQVFTMDRAKVARVMMNTAAAPRHILTSDHILRRELAGKKPFYFVTLVSEPHNMFPTASDWFRHEYRAATGIEAHDFNHNTPAREYALGPHKLLLLSAQASREEQEKILSGFLGKKVAPIDPDKAVHAATLMSRAGAIMTPLSLLKDVDHPKAGKLRDGLAAQARLANSGFEFSAKAECAYMPNPRCVLYNAHQSLPFHTSGYATRTQGLVSALHDHGWDVHVVTRAGYPHDTRKAPDDNTKTIDGIPYHFDTGTTSGQWDAPLDAYIARAAEYLVEQGKVLKPAILHTASNFMCGLAGIEAARRLGIPSVYEMRGLWHITRWSKESNYDRSEKFALAEKLELDCARGATRVIAITGALKEWLVMRGVPADKISIAPNAVDTDLFVPHRRDKKFARQHGCKGKIVIGYIGSFVSYEGLDLLLEAVAKMPRRERVKLLWMGDGPMLPEWLRKAEQLGLSDAVISLGRRPFDDVPRAYSIVDIAVFPRKGLPVCEIISPLKPFEAMAMGKAVITSDVRPLKEIVQDGVTGLVHRKDDPQSLMLTLSKLVDDEALRKSLGSSAREWVLETRQWRRIANDVTKAYREIA